MPQYHALTSKDTTSRPNQTPFNPWNPEFDSLNPSFIVPGNSRNAPGIMKGKVDAVLFAAFAS
jgi:hypothetical protein